MAIVAACTGAIGCNSPQPQTGTNTNWACTVDADCIEHAGTTCEDGQCAQSAAAAVSSGSPIIGRLTTVQATDAGFIATGHRIRVPGPNASLVATSSNGRDWVTIDAEGEGFDAAAFGNGTLVASSRVSDKPGLVTKSPNAGWQLHRTGADIDTVLFGNGVFFAPLRNGGGNWVSTDGVDWSPAPSTDTERYGFQDGQFIGWWSDRLLDPSRTAMRTSMDGITWSDARSMPAPLGPVTTRLLLAHVGDETIGTGYWTCDGDYCVVPALVVWPNGMNAWAPATVKAPWSDPQFMPAAITASDDRLVIATIKDDSTTSQIWTTALPRDSEPWHKADIPPGWQLFDLAYHAGVFVVVGQQIVDHWRPVLATSTDGLNWQEVTLAQ